MEFSHKLVQAKVYAFRHLAGRWTSQGYLICPSYGMAGSRIAPEVFDAPSTALSLGFLGELDAFCGWRFLWNQKSCLTATWSPESAILEKTGYVSQSICSQSPQEVLIGLIIDYLFLPEKESQSQVGLRTAEWGHC